MNSALDVEPEELDPAEPAEGGLLHIYLSNRHALINAAMRVLGSRHHAEDIVQDAFLRLQSVSPAEGIRSQASYLFRVVRNLAIDSYRRQGLEQKWKAPEEEGLHVPAPQSGPDVAAQKRQALAALSEALQELPPRTRQAFEMCRVQGMTQKEVAVALGVSTTLVNFMITDALIHCRASMTRRQAL
jgi:RNA polymerase sigma-70 factor (ECF subfamily)